MSEQTVDSTRQGHREQATRIRDVLRTGDADALAAAVGDLRPADVADALDDLLARDKVRLFEAMAVEAAGQMLDEADEQSQQEIIAASEDTRLIEVLEELPPDKAADVLGTVAEQDAARLLDQMSWESAAHLECLMEYPADSAGGLMTTDLVKLSSDMTVAESLQYTHSAAPGEGVRYPYVVNAQDELVGVVPLHKLVFGPRDANIGDIMQTDVLSVPADADQEEVGRIVRRYDLYAVPVVDGHNRLLGTVTVDDVIEAMEEEASEDMYRMAGTSERDPLHGSLATKIRLRLPWLVVTLFGGVLVCGVVRTFESSIARIVAVASFLPLIPLIGGNVAVQASTIIVRGIALGKVNSGRALRLLLRELTASVVLGLVCGAIAGLIASASCGNPALAGVVATAVLVAVLVASFMGTLVPLVFHSVGVDPALAAGPFVTILNDLVSIAAYLGLATAFLKAV